MAKIPFTLEVWLKDKSQRVETRDGRLVHNIWRVKEPTYTNNRRTEVCALIDGEEDALVFFEGGRYLPTTQDTNSPFDLFIITQEPELSEFENKLRVICEDAVRESQLFPERTSEDFAKKHSAELLDLARKELEQEWPSIIQAQSFNAGLKQGKVEALKDLPKWKKCDTNTIYNIKFGAITNGVGRILMVEGYQINVDSLEKLPGFKED